MNFWKSAAGVYEIEIISASLTATLSRLNNAGISLWDIRHIDQLTVQVAVYKHQYELIRRIIDACGDAVSIKKTRGLYWNISSLRYRPVLIAGMAILLLVALYTPTRVLFVRVEGNTEIADNLIIEKAEICGIKFGASRRAVRSEKIKNALLEVMPDLEWAGINTYGCVAVISVKERSNPQFSEKDSAVASVVAKCDGIVTKITTIRGNPICKIGQAVKKGQILISGYTDCGLSLRAERAEGEVFAETRREIIALSPIKFTKREGQTGIKRRYSLVFGKNIINFYKDSGISDSSCVKMYKEKFVTLPGGFRLPIIVIIEEQICSATSSEVDTDAENYLWHNDYSADYLKGQMLSGEIIKQSSVGFCQDEAYITKANYACNEMIGQIRGEEILHNDG